MLKEYVVFFSRSRSHQGIRQTIPERMEISGEEKPEGKIISFLVLNELQHDYRRVA